MPQFVDDDEQREQNHECNGRDDERHARGGTSQFIRERGSETTRPVDILKVFHTHFQLRPG
jgi:hypothetical protein